MVACKVSKLKRTGCYYGSVSTPLHSSIPAILISMGYLFYSLQIGSLAPLAEVWQETAGARWWGRKGYRREIRQGSEEYLSWWEQITKMVCVCACLNGGPPKKLRKLTWAGVILHQNPGALVEVWRLCLSCRLTVKSSGVSGKTYPLAHYVHKQYICFSLTAQQFTQSHISAGWGPIEVGKEAEMVAPSLPPSSHPQQNEWHCFMVAYLVSSLH